jgi:8-oxo-dGTP diphosphatase
MVWSYPFPRPAVTADALLFRRAGSTLEVLLIERGHDPFAGYWALPGGFVEPDEPLERAARRELAEETGLAVSELVQLGAFGDPGRDPRGHVVTVVYLGLVRAEPQPLEAASDAARAQWWPLERLPSLAFDHDRIIAAGRDRLRELARLRPQRFRLFAETDGEPAGED